MIQLNETETQILQDLWNINNINYVNTKYKNLPPTCLKWINTI